MMDDTLPLSEPTGLATAPTTTPTQAPEKTPIKAGFSLPGLLGRLGLFATYITAAVLLVVLAADASVALLGPRPSYWLALLLGAGPLVALLLSTFASYVNYYGTWRILRHRDEYDVAADLKSHAADVPQALQSALAGRTGCVPLVSSLALVLSLALVGLIVVPPNVPILGTISSYTVQIGALANTVVYVTPPPGTGATGPNAHSSPTTAPTGVATAALPTPSATPCPTLQARIASPADNTTYYSNQSIPFAGAVTGTCGAIPDSDLTWTATETGSGAITQLGNGAKVSATLSAGTYAINFAATDPTSEQTSTANITVTVYVYLT